MKDPNIVRTPDWDDQLLDTFEASVHAQREMSLGAIDGVGGVIEKWRQQDMEVTLNRYVGTELEGIATPDDYPVQVDGGSMNVHVTGNGPRAVVILSGRGVTSPADEYKPLSTTLANEAGEGEEACTVYTIEPLGFGMSDMTRKPRTPENIVAEAHQALEQLGVRDYILVAHSISGLYGLQYANTYPSEVNGVVCIDTAFPGMDDFLTPELLAETSGSSDGEEQPYDVEAEIGDVVGYVYSDAEKARMAMLHERNHTHDDEFTATKQRSPDGSRIPQAYDTMYFPHDIPTVFALSSESCNVAPWYEPEHKKQMTTAPGSQTVVLDGQHFLHHQQSAAIASIIRKVPVKAAQ